MNTIKRKLIIRMKITRMRIEIQIGGFKQLVNRKLFKLKMFKHRIFRNIINKKIGISLGKKINRFIKSYGSTHFAIRRPLVNLLCAMIAQIDEQEYKACRGTKTWTK